jgi:hypothetical protein
VEFLCVENELNEVDEADEAGGAGGEEIIFSKCRRSLHLSFAGL